MQFLLCWRVRSPKHSTHCLHDKRASHSRGGLKKSSPSAKDSSLRKQRGAPFGERNRRKLIADYLAQFGAPTAASAWKTVYGLLLWIDRSIGLAHCYESDKCQPGCRWYGRTLAFHNWLAEQFGTTPLELGRQLDWLFEAALAKYRDGLEGKLHARKLKGELQRAAFRTTFPLPGDDPELERIVNEILASYFTIKPPKETFDVLGEQLREYWRQENKRKNLLGEGFEDVLCTVISVVAANNVTARTRTSIAEVAGFSAPGAKDKATKVDLVIERPNIGRPALVNVKWSFRADREDQLWDDFREYVHFDRNRRGFDHFLITNEFDPARLNAVCNRMEANSFVFKNVVHINVDAVLAAYSLPAAAEGSEKPAGEELSSMARVRRQTADGRLIGLGDWLISLGANG